ncbi:hypothetical protein ILUMI_06638 [Ignelater luminosus]|uniref:PiggyBac transposable element-derived protein domain-containing protein n=1 Tax=Ignelater luminosus TaxID=2038154 RepID=A0A8K0GCD6_IGNLU|nr:hypothetical protein ILUMI_06638 [Ignelater luminosus]
MVKFLQNENCNKTVDPPSVSSSTSSKEGTGSGNIEAILPSTKTEKTIQIFQEELSLQERTELNEVSKIEKIYPGKQPDGSYQQSNSPVDAVKRVVEPVQSTNRNITMDIWFISIPLPMELLKYKNLLVVSTMHHDNETDPVTKKPEIIMEYNRSRFGGDMVDKMCTLYNVSRNSRRWPLTSFSDLMNIGKLNALNLYVANKNYEKIEKREFLSTLAKDLSKPLILKRTYMKNIPKNIRNRIRFLVRLDNSLTSEEEPQAKVARIGKRTLSSLFTKQEDTCLRPVFYSWMEQQAGRGATQISSVLLDFLKQTTFSPDINYVKTFL